MQLDDLVTGQMVKLKNGNTYMVLRNTIHGDILSSLVYNNKLFKDYDKNMNHLSNPDFDICEIYNHTELNHIHMASECFSTDLVWKRTEAKEIPMSKVMDILAKELGCDKESIKITN